MANYNDYIILWLSAKIIAKKLITICASENKWQLNAVLPTISIVGQKVGQEVTCDTMIQCDTMWSSQEPHCISNVVYSQTSQLCHRQKWMKWIGNTRNTRKGQKSMHGVCWSYTKYKQMPMSLPFNASASWHFWLILRKIIYLPVENTMPATPKIFLGRPMKGWPILWQIQIKNGQLKKTWQVSVFDVWSIHDSYL